MYKATLSFTTNDYDVRKNQILADDFTVQSEIDEYLRIGYIVEYDGTLEITQNGLYDVEDYEQANVDVPSGEPNLQDKTVSITTNGTSTISADSGYDGLDEVEVTTNVQPNLQSKSVEITTNTTTNILADTGYDGLSSVAVTTNVSGGADLSQYFTSTIKGGNGNNIGITGMIKTIPSDTIVSGDTMLYAFRGFGNLESIPVLDTSNVTNMGYMCTSCAKLKTFPLLNTAKVISFYQTFAYCYALEDVPALDTSSVTNFTQMFSSCNKLTNESLNNIMQMCINASAYTGTKTLATLGLTQAQATTCQSLSNYQAFINAGWTTGW